MKLAWAALFLFLAPAVAQDDALYAEGRYDAAIKADLARNDGQGFAWAARAALAEEASSDQRCLPCLERAESYARRAIAADPKLSDGYIYLAISLGLEARIEGLAEARSKGYASQAKTALDEARALDPQNVWALAGLGGWNIEVVHGGGAVLAYLIFGATLERGRALFDQAIALAPDNIAIRFQYALTLSGYDPDRFQSKIEDLLVHATAGRAGTAYGRVLQKRAGELLVLLRKGDREQFAARVRAYAGYLTTPAE